MPLCLYSELSIVPVRPPDESDTLNLLRRKFFNALVLASNKPQAPNLTTIREGNVPATANWCIR